MLFYLTALFSGLLVVSNILGVKLFSIGPFMMPAAVVVYMATFLITDVIGEVYGRKNARRTVQAGFFTQIIALVFIYLAIELPAAPAFGMQAEYAMVLGGSFQVIAASLVSYLISQNLDVTIFHTLKKKHGKKKLWFRNNLSTAAAQLADTVIFIVIAFWGAVPTQAMLGMIGAQYIVKLIIALVDTPVVYLLVKMAGRGKAAEPMAYDSARVQS
ncbi:queuosine precursor transporter [Salinicoccus albus]|uniref:queuosine precursor transporter n=1 Tax=Salinicoccus albus TaxID=418756 RepID=UPI0003629F56|nr:queuosine precursor transporter [Salinicoccus albus]